jgi:hypothetical protein
MFEKMVLRRKCGHTRQRATACLRLWHKEFTDFYCLPIIIRIIKVRRVRWSGHRAQERKIKEYGVLVGKFERRRSLLKI